MVRKQRTHIELKLAKNDWFKYTHVIVILRLVFYNRLRYISELSCSFHHRWWPHRRIAQLRMLAERRHVLVLFATFAAHVDATTFPARVIVEIAQQSIVAAARTPIHFRSSNLGTSGHREFGTQAATDAARRQVASQQILVDETMQWRRIPLRRRRVMTSWWCFGVRRIAGVGIGLEGIVENICDLWMIGNESFFTTECTEGGSKRGR